MASVWVARLTGKHGFEKLCALKTILPHYAQDSRFRTMFLDEARVASRIEHPNVAQVLDLGEVGDVLYLVMEWVDGDSLSKLHRRVQKHGDKVPMGVLLRVLADTCAGLHAAHEVRGDDGDMLGVVHRDVSPQNILVSTKGSAKLIDFGVVKARGRVAAETSSGQLKGKIHYMAPEQALGQPVDRRADLWSIAAVAYSFLAGVPPFDGANELATLHLVTSGVPPPPLPSHVPAPVADVILGALVADVDGRSPPTALDMQLALEEAMRVTGHVTNVADVAAFTTRYLGDRSDARKRALDTALMAAAERKRIQSVLKPLEGDSASGVGSSPIGAAMMHRMIPTPLDVDVAFESEESASVSQVARSAGFNVMASEVRPAPGRPQTRGFWIAALCALVLAVGLVALWLHDRAIVAATAASSTAAVPSPAPPLVTAPAVTESASAAAPPAPASGTTAAARPAVVPPQTTRPTARPKPPPAAGHPKTDYGF
jgi:serine/threonine protein kinase